MKPLKLGLRIWFTITGILSFLGGWLLFSHAGKPAPLSMFQSAPSPVTNSSAAPAPLPTLAPIPSLDSLTNGSSSALQPLPQTPSISSSQNFFPRMVTRGS